MMSRWSIACVSLVVLLSVASVARSQQNPYRLKEPDQKKLCLACHTDFEQKLKNRFVHTPVRSGECSGCHDPHVSSHGKLLADEPREVCARCHDGVIPAKVKSTHKVVADGECQKCHDPHGSDNPANLLAKGNDLCFGCHKELGEAVKKARFKHSPVEQGCLTCHGPHASDRAERLLKDAVPALCVNCHKPDTPAFTARHMGRISRRCSRTASTRHSATARATSATRRQIPPRPSPPSATASNSARAVTAKWSTR
jgi:DmsE family decaheme c-type cytochrome